jgi:hypothetical protein
MHLSAQIAADFKDLKVPVSYQEMSVFLNKIKNKQIEVIDAGTSFEGRQLFLVHIEPAGKGPFTRIFFFGQQHGNEPAGKDALIYLVKEIAEKSLIIPDNVDLWVMPMVNPDGAERDQRRNVHDADLNRDHVLLLQPETRILHESFRKIMPHIAVDCHEFTRDSKDYDEQGWIEWPDIMMDFGNNPLFHEEIRNLGEKWVENARQQMKKAGFNYTRYYLGGVPPGEELRHSTPEVDDARNGLATYGGLSFIIESGVLRNSKIKNADLADRIDAYLHLLKQFFSQPELLVQSRKMVEASRTRDIGSFIPTNYFWATSGVKTRDVKVIHKSDGQTGVVETANFMDRLVVKKSVSRPVAYLIPATKAAPFRALLDRQHIDYKLLNSQQDFLVEPCRLLRVEKDRDSVYNRYGGRQILEPDSVRLLSFDTGSLYISAEGANGLRSILILEPLKLYGLFQYSEYAELVTQEGIIPVYRLLKKKAL